MYKLTYITGNKTQVQWTRSYVSLFELEKCVYGLLIGCASIVYIKNEEESEIYKYRYKHNYNIDVDWADFLWHIDRKVLRHNNFRWRLLDI